jgi:predicted  nucleic acid-binding Zn-ribbon protein
MYTTETLNVLRTLNSLEKELRGLSSGSEEAQLIERQMLVTSAQLPTSAQSFHDQFAIRGKPSVVSIAGSSCAGCHLKLPSGTLGELRAPGRFIVCPHCCIYIWSGENALEEIAAPKKRISRKRILAL